MACRCAERAAALRRAVTAVKSGDVRELGREASFVGRTFIEDARSGDLRRLAQQRLMQLRQGVRR